MSFLLPYISMDLGNWLSPLIIFSVTITLVYPLFRKYEQLQEQLKIEQEAKAVLEERERIARELHDGIAQSLFLCSVQLNQIKQYQTNNLAFQNLEKNLREVHDSVRNAITNLKNPPPPSVAFAFKKQIEEMCTKFQENTGIDCLFQLQIKDTDLTTKEKLTLSACIQEGLNNIWKHAQATHVTLSLTPWKQGWRLDLIDNGQGFTINPFSKENCFGLRIMRERANTINAKFSLTREKEFTKLSMWKGV